MNYRSSVMLRRCRLIPPGLGLLLAFVCVFSLHLYMCSACICMCVQLAFEVELAFVKFSLHS